MYRLFVGLALPDSVADHLASLAEPIPGARWVAPENLHLTLAFLGEIDGHRAQDADDALAAVDAPGFTLTLAGLGQFGQGRRARALWIGVEPCPALMHLQRKVATAIERAGIALEGRRFTPHVTLARLRDPDQPLLGAFIARTAGIRLSAFSVESFTLFESYLGSDGAQYDPLRRYPLRHAEPAHRD